MRLSQEVVLLDSFFRASEWRQKLPLMVCPRCCCVRVQYQSLYGSQVYLFSNFTSTYGLERIDMSPLRMAGAGCKLLCPGLRRPQHGPHTASIYWDFSLALWHKKNEDKCGISRIKTRTCLLPPSRRPLLAQNSQAPWAKEKMPCPARHSIYTVQLVSAFVPGFG